MFYKAIEKYYTEKEYGSVQCTDIIGFGQGNSLEEIRRKYQPNIIIEQITEQELNDLWAEVKKQSEKSEWD